MRGRGIEHLNRLAEGIDQVDHPLQQLGTYAPALGTVVHFELHALNRVLFLRREALPPGSEGIDDEGTGFGRTPEGHMELGGLLIKNPTRDIGFGAAKVRVTGFVVPARLSAPRERA